MINNVVIAGRLTRDADQQFTGSGIEVANLSLAVERPFKSANGEREVDFINVVAWRKTAEIIRKYTRKGSMIGITGRIQTRNYTNNEGRKVYITEVVAEQVQLLGNKNEREDVQSNSQGNQSESRGTTPEDAFDGDSSIDISDEDLPF
ncbi:single-stranded DNA-binding protein [Alkalibacterium sp. MB6]|uniref:single-stranded DNA-binding protein n=1 Tax=Alkalibacterium sp. MB6 TaxID=2081965 RepID=UPI00137B34FF|nr:single-stranded DNA-binding protein [Alkalibacterium sp. MB6]